MTETKKAVYMLAFNVYPEGDNLFSACIIKLKDGKVSEWRRGVATTLGHASSIAENLLSAHTLYMHEQDAESFYRDANLV